MFNKTFITEQGHTEYVPYEKMVTVNRAPTDKSVELLKEFEDRALQKIVETYFIENSVAKGVVLKTLKSPISLAETFIMVFDLNGKRHRVEKNIKEWHFYHKDIEPKPEQIFADVLRDYILQEILKGIKCVRM